MTPKQKRTLTAVLCILSNLLIVLATVLAMSGCAEEEAPQPIHITVVSPDPESPPVVTVAEPEPDAEPAPDPEVAGILAQVRLKLRRALRAWSQGQQEAGNVAYIDTVETAWQLIAEHGWTEADVLTAINKIVTEEILVYKDDINALKRINNSLFALLEELGLLDN